MTREKKSFKMKKIIEEAKENFYLKNLN